MQNVDLHIHTSYSDGEDSPLEVIKKAIDMGIDKIGFSDHSYTPFDESYCIKKDEITSYKTCINQLKSEFSDKIEILLGIEQDYHSEESTDSYDYVIGSVHYIKIFNDYIPVDETAQILIDAASKYFNGNIYDLIDLYYETVSDLVNKTNADIIGHIDLITKSNADSVLFDEKDPRYIKAYKKACDKLIITGKLFEINTGCIARGYKNSPYPSNDIYSYLKSKGAKFILSSDSHSCKTLCYKFEKFNNLL